MCVEIFAWGKYGGFGKATRKIGGELVKRGCEVYAVVPRRRGQRKLEELDGIKVYSFPLYNPFSLIPILRSINADIYHSEEPSLLTYLAEKFQPTKKHLITFRDTRDRDAWKTEMDNPSLSRLQVLFNRIFEDSFPVWRAVKKADCLCAAAKCVAERAKKKYRLRKEPVHLPTPVDMGQDIEKAKKPTVCFLARFDKRKKPEVFFELTKRFPEVHFIALGHSRNKEFGEYLFETYGDLPNLDMLGFVDHFHSRMLSEVLGKSWIMVNTSLREGLPNSFLEAAAHKCALLASVDPDGLTSRFGRVVSDRDFGAGLKWLLQNERWRIRGEAAYDFVKKNYATDVAMDKHAELYKSLVAKS